MRFQSMAIFAVGKQGRRRAPGRRRRSLFAAGAALASSVIALGSAAWADTTGDFPGFGIPGTPSTDANWGFIQNEYLLVSVGWAGSYAANNITSNIPGRISIGTTGGSPRTNRDDNIPLMGRQARYGTLAVWPYAGSFNDFGDFPSYVRLLIDGTDQFNLGFDTATLVLSPRFRMERAGPALISRYVLGANSTIQVDQRISLMRDQCRLEWTITNLDLTTAHTVGLRWTTNIRPQVGWSFSSLSNGGFFWQHPDRGTTADVQMFTGAQIPELLHFYNRRADDQTTTDESFSVRQTFRGADATVPTKVYVGDASELIPVNAGGLFGPYDLDPTTNPGLGPKFETSVGAATYFGGPTGYTIQPGNAVRVVTYYGLGTASELLNHDIVTAVEGPESLQYRAEAALDPEVAGNTSATLETVGVRFLTAGLGDAEKPWRFKIYGSVYNQTPFEPSDATYGVTMSGVRMSLTLPSGLKFSTFPQTTTVDQAAKDAAPRGTRAGNGGVLAADQDGTAEWYVEADGTRFGPLAYQMAVTVNQPNPLSRSLSRIINIPAVPLVELTPGAFQMVGFPFAFDQLLTNNYDPDTILNKLTRPEDDVVIWEYTGNANQPYQKATQLTPGKGYFFRPNIGSNGKRLIFLNGARPVPYQAQLGTASQRLPELNLELKEGWNIVSNPYVYEIPLNYLILQFPSSQGNNTLQVVAFSDAVRSGLVRGGIFYYSPGERSYRLVESLSTAIKPWQAYWLYSNVKAKLVYATPTLRQSLIIPRIDSTTGEQTEPATRSKAQSAEDWLLQIVARRSDGSQDTSTSVGVSASARNDGSTDLPKPPPIDDYLYTGLTKPGASTRYARILQGPGGKKTWDLTVESDRDSDATLLWPDAKKLPRRVRVSITDLQTNRTIDVRSTSSLPVRLRRGTVSRYRVTAQIATSQPLVIGALNMTRTRGTTGGSIAFTLSQNATVTARVLTAAGRVVQVLESGRSVGAGETRLRWDGRSSQGAPVPMGAYVVEVTAVGEDGLPARRQGTFVTVQ